MKQKLAESSDFKIVLHLSIYFSAGMESMISLTCSLVGITVTVTKERYVKMLQKIFPEDSLDNLSEPMFMHRHTIRDGYGVVEE